MSAQTEAKKAMPKWKRDVIYGIGLEVLCLVGYLATRGMSGGTSKIWQTRPDVYTWLWLIVLAILSLILIVRAVMKKDETPCEPIWSKAGVVTVVAMVLYLFSMDIIGFIITTLIFTWVMIVYYSWKMEKLNCQGAERNKKLVIYLIAAIITTLATYWIFTSLLDVRLPSGIFF